MRISEALISPLLGEHADDIGWRAWLALVEWFNTMSMMAPTFTRADVQRLDSQIQAHHDLYCQVPGAHFIPKNHFAHHVPADIPRCGPPRVYACHPFEGYLRRVKRWCAHSNRKAELMHVARMLSLQTSVELIERESKPKV